MNHTKGQAFTPDFLGSIVVFGVMSGVFLLTWNLVLDAQILSFEERDRYEVGDRTVHQLVTTSTQDWEDPNKIGLAKQPYIIDEQEVENFRDLEESEKSVLLRAQNFSLTIETDHEEIQLGSEPGGTEATPFRRQVLYNNSESLELAEVVLTVWE